MPNCPINFIFHINYPQKEITSNEKRVILKCDTETINTYTYNMLLKMNDKNKTVKIDFKQNYL